MKLAIHHRPGSFSDRWIAYCEQENIAYKIVNAFHNDIVEQVKGCDVLMWHHHHGKYRDVIAAKKILFALEHAGIKVFPNFHTVWHFDDKVAQKYLLEAIDAPLVPSYVFYDKKEAINWANKTTYPKVFKLKGGAGSQNVKLVSNKKRCKKIIKKAFRKGFSQYDSINGLKERYYKFKKNKDIKEVLKGFYRLFFHPQFARLSKREKGYVYFQEFIKNEGFDVRVVVVNGKAVSLKRMVRENDFRASGSGKLIFENDKIDINYIKKSFDLSEKLSTQSIAIDFIKSNKGKIYIVEISYGFPMENFLDGAAGFWDKKLSWHNVDISLQNWMVESLIKN